MGDFMSNQPGGGTLVSNDSIMYEDIKFQIFENLYTGIINV